MTTLIDLAERESRLALAGVPESFLHAFHDVTLLGDLQFLIASADKTYDYYNASPQLFDRYGVDFVIPVYADANGDYFVDLFGTDRGTTFSKSYLESSVRLDYGSRFNAVLFHLTIELWEFAEQPDSEIAQQMESLGYSHAPRLVAALQSASRTTFDADQQWREQNLNDFL